MAPSAANVAVEAMAAMVAAMEEALAVIWAELTVAAERAGELVVVMADASVVVQVAVVVEMAVVVEHRLGTWATAVVESMAQGSGVVLVAEAAEVEVRAGVVKVVVKVALLAVVRRGEGMMEQEAMVVAEKALDLCKRGCPLDSAGEGHSLPRNSTHVG